MNLYNYKVLYLGRHQDLLAQAAEIRLANLAQENHAKTSRNFPKFIGDVLQKVGQNFKNFPTFAKRLNLEKTSS